MIKEKLQEKKWHGLKGTINKEGKIISEEVTTTRKKYYIDCPTVRNWQARFVLTNFGGMPLSEVELIKFWFLGMLPRDHKPNLAVLTAVLIFQYCIWEEKLRKRCPSFTTISNLFKDHISSVFDRSLSHREAAANLPFPLFRPQWALGVH
jgi:hypothetical protein